eukprot:scaffold14.g1054.t1
MGDGAAAAAHADGLVAKLGALGVPPTPEAEQAHALSLDDEVSTSPSAVAGLAAAALLSAASSLPSTPPGPGSAASSGGGGAAAPPHRGSQGSSGGRCGGLSPVGSAGDLEQPPLEVDLEFLCDRLKRGPLTGQVVAWGWAQARRLCLVRRAMPNQLFSSLWAATEACAARMTPQDAVEVLEAWLVILRQCPRHFRLSVAATDAMANLTLPAAVKRLDERQLAHVAGLCRDMALLRNETDLSASAVPPRRGGPPSPTGAPGSSPRDLLQPVASLLAAEAAWRASNPARHALSPETVAAVLETAKAWRWGVVRHRDSQALAALKEATAAALELLHAAQAAQQQASAASAPPEQQQAGERIP